MTTENSVQAIANFMAEAEKRAHLNVKGARDLRDEFKDISDSGSVPVLKVSRYHAELVALTTGYAAALLDLHDRMTDTAKLYNIDVPPAQETQGDDIGILSGGGR